MNKASTLPHIKILMIKIDKLKKMKDNLFMFEPLHTKVLCTLQMFKDRHTFFKAFIRGRKYFNAKNEDFLNYPNCTYVCKGKNNYNYMIT